MSSIGQQVKQTLAETAGAAHVDPRVVQRSSVFMQTNEGPAAICARITGVKEERAKDDAPYFTNNEGIPLPTPNYTLNVGGIPVVSDIFLFQKQQHFNRSKTLERMVHPCGSGAFGYFECTNDMGHLTKASIFASAGKKTPVFTRFSTVTYGREFPDEGRNPRGFATKFYSEDGNYDIVGLNWPIFFLRDPMKGPDNIRSQQRNPQNFMIDYDSWFDYLACNPESMHAGLMLMSDHGTPVGWRFMNGYGCHTFKWVNKDGKAVYIKYHFMNETPNKNFTWEEAVKMCGEDPDFSKRDLWAHIEKGGEAAWKLHVQTMDPNEAATLDFDPFDVTKVWPRKRFPLQEVGRLVLNRNPEDYHRDVEQAAFSPGSMIPGIEPSPDMLLQWRCFFYRDAQYHRLGINLHQIPVNCPFMAGSYSSLNFAGALRSDANTGMNPHYSQNSYDTPKFRPDTDHHPMEVGDNILSRKGHFLHEGKASEYDQVRELYQRVMSQQERANTHKNTAVVLKLTEPRIQKKYLVQCCAVDPAYAQGIYDLLPSPEFSMGEVKESAKEAHLVGLEQKYASTTRPGGKCLKYST
ncbi:catalase [Heliocybe sulcata]|uniref:Catalase n=1 Tax=Heliocybe sulcata TaxID=5364 RepID=A0A5C3MKW3_9AGAM|nr:catalase [Heliocybe sulcata]